MDEDLLSLLKTIDKYHNFFPEMAYVAMCRDLRRIHIKLSEKRRVRAGRGGADRRRGDHRLEISQGLV